jgi:hypothetical protein
MAPTNDNNTRQEFDSRLAQPVPQRPKTLLQRISSGFSSMLPTITLRKGRTKTSLSRPTTAPVHGRRFGHTSLRNRFSLPGSRQFSVPQFDIPKLSEPEECSYDAHTCYSFPSIELTQCDCCCSKPHSQAISRSQASNLPCRLCRANSPFSHLTTGFRRPHDQTRSTSAIESSIAQMMADLSSTEEGPRLVPTDRAAGRYMNPPRIVTLPGNRVPLYNRLSLPLTQHESLTNSQRQPDCSVSMASGSSTSSNPRSRHASDARPKSTTSTSFPVLTTTPSSTGVKSMHTWQQYVPVRQALSAAVSTKPETLRHPEVHIKTSHAQCSTVLLQHQHQLDGCQARTISCSVWKLVGLFSSGKSEAVYLETWTGSCRVVGFTGGDYYVMTLKRHFLATTLSLALVH